ncbi:S8 family serine peptidase [Kribbella sp. WER1]
MHKRHLSNLGGLLLATGLVTGMVAVPGTAPPASATPVPAAPKTAALPPGQVTLLTGDRVTIGEHGAVRTVRGAGRTVAFQQRRIGDKLYVIPSDVAPAVAAGKLDRALFDVAGLIRQGLDDRKTKDVPLLVTYDGKSKARAFAAAKVERSLPAINSVALKVDKRDAATFLPQATGAGVEKVWLDARYRPTLDKSVPQIGAPAAWQAGFTGKGVTVAVLDTGIDAQHADLKTQVAGAHNFTDEAAGDLVGHGTHVASTIAGTGAASGGKYRGVAPDARLYDGKVCTVFDCQMSAILAGMEWAATEVKAKVVNMSIGGDPGPGTDPVEAAIARLTAQTGTLFVVAAGNSGDGPGTIESPGRAAAALTVGAVDKQDQLAGFSSRGPLTDGTIKPDLTAPGVAIVTARAAGSDLGDPVGDDYMSLDGTSMATPHAAGAAALLLQQHPDWQAGRLKSQLVSSAKTLPGQTGDEQGAGRLDVANAVVNPVVAETGSLWFGTAVWPHDDDQPITKNLVYRNDGDKPVDLTLNATLLGQDHQPAPDGMVELGTTTLTVPAHGTANLPVTMNTRSGPDGRYSGEVIARSGDRTISAAIAVDKEVESYNLTVKHIGPDGKPAPTATTSVLDDNYQTRTLQDPSGTVTVRVPKAKYELENGLVVPRGDRSDTYLMIQPYLDLTTDTTVVMDARLAKPFRITARPAGAAVVSGAIGLWMNDWRGSTEYDFTGQAGLSGLFTAHIGPTHPGDTGYVSTMWARQGTDGGFANSPYLLNQTDQTPDRFPTGFARVLDPASMIRVDQALLATSNRQAEVADTDGYGASAQLDYALPAHRQVFHDPQPDRLVRPGYTTVSEFEPGAERVYRTEVDHLNQRYRAGQRYRERYNAAVFAPSSGLALRQGGSLQFRLRSLVDPEGIAGGGVWQDGTSDSQDTKLYQDGKLVQENPGNFGYLDAEGLPSAATTYKLVTTVDRHTISRLSSKVDYAWTFRSAAVGDVQWLAPLAVGYAPEVDDHNVTPRRPVTVLPVTIRPPWKDHDPDESVLPGIQRVSIEYQGAAGAAWLPAKVVRKAPGKYVAAFPTPAGTSVSLRATVVDAEGNTTVQTVTDAMLLAK